MFLNRLPEALIKDIKLDFTAKDLRERGSAAIPSIDSTCINIKLMLDRHYTHVDGIEFLEILLKNVLCILEAKNNKHHRYNIDHFQCKISAPICISHNACRVVEGIFKQHGFYCTATPDFYSPSTTMHLSLGWDETDVGLSEFYQDGKQHNTHPVYEDLDRLGDLPQDRLVKIQQAEGALVELCVEDQVRAFVNILQISDPSTRSKFIEGIKGYFYE